MAAKPIYNTTVLALCYDAYDLADRLEDTAPEQAVELVTLASSVKSAVVFNLHKRTVTFKPDMLLLYQRLYNEVSRLHSTEGVA